jgi:hypothetical protein
MAEDTPLTILFTADNPRRGAGPQRCLRLDQGEYNVGDGPLELPNYPMQGAGHEMWQRIYRADGPLHGGDATPC